MALLMSSALCLLGILIYGSFLEAEAADCEKGWEKYKVHCYKFFEDKLPWMEAEIQCQIHGCRSHLVSIHSKEESLWVANYIRKHKPVKHGVWMGLADLRQNGKWSWTDRTAVNYMAWMKNQPNNLDDTEYCGELSNRSDLKQWNDIRCIEFRPYLCKDNH